MPSEDESRVHGLGGQRRSEELTQEDQSCHCIQGGRGGRRRGDVRTSEGPVQETPARILSSPSKALALKPLVSSSAEQVSKCARLRYP